MAKSRDPSIEDEIVRSVEESLEEGKFPFRFYNDPDVHKLEMDRIFGNEWIFVGHESEIPEPGDYARRYIGNDPFIFVRDEKGEINLLFDACRHHGAQLCRAEQGNTSHFRCPYHGWTYKNDGDLIGVPQKNTGFKNLDRDENGLFHVPRLESYKGLVFGSLAEEGPSLEEHLGGYKWYLDIQLDMADGGMEVMGEPHRWEIDANWKVLSENLNGDSYHTAWAHGSILDLELGGEETVGGAGTGESIDRHVYVDGHTLSTRMLDESVYLTYPEEVQSILTDDGLSEEQFDIARRALQFVGSIFPNFGLIHFGNTTDDSAKDVCPFFTIRKWRPMGPDKMEIWSWALVPKEAPQEFKERMYKVYSGNFGPTGNFEQDDISLWEGITDSAQAQVARQQNYELNYQMGMEWMTDVDIDEDWKGPGTAYTENLQEGGMRQFHEQWYEAVIDEEGRSQ
ncbi:aromatic ring-hydroxylating oxygenase subunit alpha [Natrialbaceae archaeon A-gly3]